MMKDKQGYALGHPPYGYVYCTENPKLWAIDEEASKVVEYIYKLRLEGYGIQAIADKLLADKIYCPTIYALKTGRKKPKKLATRGDYFWATSVVSTILKNQCYTGDVVNNKTYSISYKLKKRLANDKEKWNIHPNRHPAIIEREQWEIVQSKFSNSNYRKPKYTEKNIFAGFLKCSDCGKNLNHKHFNTASHNDYFSCGANRNSKTLCPKTHHIRIDYLTQGVRAAIDNLVRFARDYEDDFVKIVCDEHYKIVCFTQEQNKKKLQALKARESQLDILFEKIYEDKIGGVLSEERFLKLSAKYDLEQSELAIQLKEQQKAVDSDKSSELNVNAFLKMVRKYTRVNKLDLTILNHFIKEIVVYHREELKESTTQKIDIHFNFIGSVKLPCVDELKKYKKSFGRKKENQIAIAI